jgi:hypothetical protein
MLHQEVTPALRWARWRPPNSWTAKATAAVLSAAHVGVDEAASELPGHLGAPAVVDVGQDDSSPLAGQMTGDSLTDAVAAAGDQCDLAVHVHGPGS